MACQGFAADIYDLYVLGLLEGKERADLEAHLAENCDACIRNVRRSLDLWVMFASTLHDSEPSSDFRSRLVRIAELSKKVLVFPRHPESSGNGKFNWGWGWIAAAAAVILMLIAGAWFAGHESGSIEAQRLSGRLDASSALAASRQVALDEWMRKAVDFENQLKHTSGADTLRKTEDMRRQMLALNAEVNQYKTLLDRQKSADDENTKLMNVLSRPGVRLIALKGFETAKAASAYAFVVEGSRVIFIAGNLPQPPGEKEFQLWLLRSQDPKVVSAGTFVPDDQNRVMMEFSDPTEVSNLATIVVTDEPKGGSTDPTGTKLLVGPVTTEPDVVK
jgi:anti-sigma-K factor RskA